MRYFDPHSMSIFIAVCEEKSIVVAAKRAALVPSAVSKRIKALENQVGVQLLDRGRLRMTPTPAGEMLLRYARETLSSMEKTHAELNEFSRGLQGNIKVLASISAIYQSFPESIAEFLSLHTRVRVSVHEAISSQIVQDTKEGLADIGILSDAVDTKGLACYPYHKDELAVVSVAEHPLRQTEAVSFEEVLDNEFVNIKPGGIVNLIMQKEAATLGRNLQYRIQVSTMDVACRIVAAGLAVAIMPLQFAQLQKSYLPINVTPLTDEWAKRTLVLCTRHDQALNNSVQTLLDFLREKR